MQAASRSVETIRPHVSDLLPETMHIVSVLTPGRKFQIPL